MRVLQVINSMGTGGAEKLLLDSIPLYNKEGISTDLLLLKGTDFPFLKILKEKKCCQIISLGLGSVYNPIAIFKLIRYLKQYDVIHVHLFPAFYWVAIAKWLSFSNVILVYTEHSTYNRRMQNIFFNIIDNFIYRRYKKIVCISSEVESELKKNLTVNHSLFKLINNGVDISKLFNEIKYNKQELELKFSESDKVLVQVSSFQYPKDQPTLIRAMKLLPDNVKLLLVGHGELMTQSKTLTRDLQLENRVFFLGVRMDVPKLLKTADIVVLSSHFEGLSLSSIEGMASGKPFIASRAPGLMEIVDNAGILFEIGNHKALADSILKLLNDEHYYEATVKKCFARAREFDISIMVKKYIALYESFT